MGCATFKDSTGLLHSFLLCTLFKCSWVEIFLQVATLATRIGIISAKPALIHVSRDTQSRMFKDAGKVRMRTPNASPYLPSIAI